jgi:hypothetical protein
MNEYSFINKGAYAVSTLFTKINRSMEIDAYLRISDNYLATIFHDTDSFRDLPSQERMNNYSTNARVSPDGAGDRVGNGRGHTRVLHDGVFGEAGWIAMWKVQAGTL